MSASTGKETEKLSFHLISDIHYGHNDAAKHLKMALEDMIETNPTAAAFVSAGDQTQDGQPSDQEAFYELISNLKSYNDNNALIALGNHDVRGPYQAMIEDSTTGETVQNVWQDTPDKNNPYWNTAFHTYMKLNEPYMPEGVTTPYFDRWIEGYHFIIINPENSPKDSSHMSQTQLNWLEKKLSENKDPEKPIFIIAHQALNDTHRQSNVNFGFGPQKKAVKEIMKKYPQAIFISGHAHNGFGVVEAVQRDYGVLVDVPSFSQVWNGDLSDGSGYEVFVYQDEIHFCARNYLKKEWLPKHDIRIKLPSLPVLYHKVNQLTAEVFDNDKRWLVLKDLKDQAQELLNKEYSESELINNDPSDRLYGRSTQEEISVLQDQLKELIDSI